MKEFRHVRFIGMIFSLFLVTAVITACGDSGGGGGGGPAAATFTSVWTGIIQINCLGSGCHSTNGTGATQTGLDMGTQALAYEFLVGPAGTGIFSAEDMSILRVAPTDPNSSFLIDKLECTAVALATPPGTCMPLVTPPTPFTPLAAADIQEIRDWITAGALND